MRSILLAHSWPLGGFLLALAPALLPVVDISLLPLLLELNVDDIVASMSSKLHACDWLKSHLYMAPGLLTPDKRGVLEESARGAPTRTIGLNVELIFCCVSKVACCAIE